MAVANEVPCGLALISFRYWYGNVAQFAGTVHVFHKNSTKETLGIIEMHDVGFSEQRCLEALAYS